MTEKVIKKEEKKAKAEETLKLKGKFISAIGRRKNGVANVRVYKKGDGEIIVNGKKLKDYFTVDQATIVMSPLKFTGLHKELSCSVMVAGGGKKGQAEAIRHGITRVLVKMDELSKAQLRAKGWVTRDARKKERKKPGLKKARRAPQWSKR